MLQELENLLLMLRHPVKQAILRANRGRPTAGVLEMQAYRAKGELLEQENPHQPSLQVLSDYLAVLRVKRLWEGMHSSERGGGASGEHAG